jgi:GAF domain-containing protein
MNETKTDHIHDTDRIQEIADLDLFSENLKLLVEDLATMASEQLDLPNCAVSIVLDEAQFFLSFHGPQTDMVLASGGTPLEWSFCQHVVQNQAPFIVPDASKDEKMKDSPLVTNDGTLCYAGVPLITSKGFVIGSFCVSGTHGRQFSNEDIEYLRKMAAKAMRRIEARVGRELIRHSQTLAKIR